MNFWQYILTPTGNTLGPVAMLTIIISVLVAIAGIALVVLPREFAKQSRQGNSSTGHKERGLEERKLQAELRTKIGTAMVAWSGALILSLLLRLLGTPGLDTRLLPTLVFLILPFLVGYLIVYLLFSFPRYLQASRRIDVRKSYEPVVKKKKKATTPIPGKEKVNLMPGKAMLGLAIAPVLYYLVMVGISIPPGVPATNHDHLLHQLGMAVLALLGYLIGLASSLGDDIRPLLPWVQTTQK